MVICVGYAFSLASNYQIAKNISIFLQLNAFFPERTVTCSSRLWRILSCKFFKNRESELEILKKATEV